MPLLLRLFCGVLTTLGVAVLLVFIFSHTGVPPTTIAGLCLILSSFIGGACVTIMLNKEN